jgi:hypothetical protein
LYFVALLPRTKNVRRQTANTEVEQSTRVVSAKVNASTAPERFKEPLRYALSGTWIEMAQRIKGDTGSEGIVCMRCERAAVAVQAGISCQQYTKHVHKNRQDRMGNIG